jgi:hypothetical protein
LSPLTRLQLFNFNWEQGSFARIAQSLRASFKMKDLTITNCRFDSDSGRHLCAIFSAVASALSKLTLIGKVEFLPAMNSVVFQDLVMAPKLKELTWFINADDETVRNERFQVLRQSLTNSSCQIQRITLYGRLSGSHLEDLLIAMPLFCHLEDLSLSMESISRWKGKLFSALRSNRSLLEFSLRGDGLDNTDHANLSVYLARNRSLGNAMRAESTALASASCRGSLLPSLMRASRDGNAKMQLLHVLDALVQVGDQVGPASLTNKRSLPFHDCSTSNSKRRRIPGINL